MPTMKAETIRLHGKDWIRKIKFSGKTEEFEIMLPDYMGEVLEKSRVVGNTIAESITAWDEILEKYDGLARKERKVIVYAYKGEEKDDDRETSIRFRFWVGTEIDIGGQKKYLDLDEESRRVDDGKYGWSSELVDTILDWTAEREAFFVDLKATLIAANKRAAKFFGQSQKKILLAIDSKTKLLEFKPEKKPVVLEPKVVPNPGFIAGGAVR